MEHYAISGAEDPMGQYASEDVKAAAAAAATIGLFAGHSTKGKADKQAAASAMEKVFAMAAVATAVWHLATDAAKKADEAAAAKQAEEEEAAAAAAKQVAAVEGMTCMEYLTAYKELHPREVHLIMRYPVVRTPFTDSGTYKSLVADNPDATQDDMDRAMEEYEEELDRRTRFHDYVRSEYQAKGYVRVSDAYIASRVEIEEFSRKLMESLSSDDSDSDDDGAEEEEEEEEEAAH